MSNQVFQNVGVRASPLGALEPLTPLYNFVRSRQLEGTYPGDAGTGTWPTTGMRVLYGWGTPTETDWPRTMWEGTWPPPEPPGLDAKAKALRLYSYQRVRSAYECCVMLGHMLPVNVAVEITEQWFHAEKGEIQMPSPDEPIVGTHGMAILSFARHVGFVFLNSWGEQWGHRGFGYLPFEYFDKYLVSAWSWPGAGALPAFYTCQGIQTVSWERLDFLGNSLHGGDLIHGREVYDGTNDERIGWTFAVHREGFVDVEELFVRPQYRGRGHGRQLIEMLLALAADLKRPLRLWVPFADWTPSNLPTIERIVAKLGLDLFHANVRWAAAMALDPTALPPLSREVEYHEA